MGSSKVYSKGYCMKRLRDSGYVVDEVFSDYSEIDPRRWTIIIDPGCASVMCTCYENRNFLGEHCFEFYDGGQFFPMNRKIQTSSVEVLIEQLIQAGVNNKHPDYRKKTEIGGDGGPYVASQNADGE